MKPDSSRKPDHSLPPMNWSRARLVIGVVFCVVGLAVLLAAETIAVVVLGILVFP